MSTAEKTGTTLARLSFQLPTEGLGEFEADYESRLLPILESRAAAIGARCVRGDTHRRDGSQPAAKMGGKPPGNSRRVTFYESPAGRASDLVNRGSSQLTRCEEEA